MAYDLSSHLLSALSTEIGLFSLVGFRSGMEENLYPYINGTSIFWIDLSLKKFLLDVLLNYL